MQSRSRREFLKELFAGAASVAAFNYAYPQFSYAQSVGGSGGAPKYLVLLNLGGGPDSHYLYPYIGQLAGTMVALRGGITDGIAVNPAVCLPLNAEIGLHPLWAPMSSMHLRGNLKLVQRVGVPNSSGSHNDAANHFSFGARYAGSAGGGWLARLMNAYNFNSFDVYDFAGGRLDFAQAKVQPVSIPSGLSGQVYDQRWYKDWQSYTWNDENSYSRQITQDLLQIHVPRTETETLLRDVQKQAYASLVRAQQLAGIAVGSGYSGSNLAHNFADVERIIRSDRTTNSTESKVFYLSMGSFDSHSDQKNLLNPKISDMAQTFNAFATNLLALGPDVWNRTLILTYGEFSRQFRVGGGDGTNHGDAQSMMALGGGVNGGANAVAGTLPTVNFLNTNDVMALDIDYRNFFAEALQWMGYDPTKVFTESYEHKSIGLML